MLASMAGHRCESCIPWELWARDEEWVLKSGSVVTRGSIPDHISFGNLPVFYPSTLEDYEGQGCERWGR